MIALLLSLAVTAPQRTIEVYVDAIEYNSVFDRRLNRTIEQVIFRDRNPATGRMQVRSWKMADGDYPVRSNRLVRYDYRSEGINYRVKSRIYRESWTMRDSERDDLATHPERYPFPQVITEVNE